MKRTLARLRRWIKREPPLIDQWQRIQREYRERREQEQAKRTVPFGADEITKE